MVSHVQKPRSYKLHKGQESPLLQEQRGSRDVAMGTQRGHGDVTKVTHRIHGNVAMGTQQGHGDVTMGTMGPWRCDHGRTVKQAGAAMEGCSDQDGMGRSRLPLASSLRCAPRAGPGPVSQEGALETLGGWCVRWSDPQGVQLSAGWVCPTSTPAGAKGQHRAERRAMGWGKEMTPVPQEDLQDHSTRPLHGPKPSCHQGYRQLQEK